MRRNDIENKIIQSSQTQVVLEGLNIGDNEVQEIAQTIKKMRPEVEEIFLKNNKKSRKLTN